MTDMSERLVVIGGTAAGLSAASAAKRAKPEMIVRVFERTGYISYGSCGLPYFIGGTIEDAGELITYTPEQMREKRDVEVFTAYEALSIDRERKTVSVKNLASGEITTEPYTKLVIATGASAIRPKLPGIEKNNVFTVRCVEDGIAIRAALAGGAKNVVIVGGGFIGLETAAEIREAGHNVTVIEALPRLLPALPEEYSELLAKELEHNGVKLLLGARVSELCGKDSVSAVKTETDELKADIVIVSVGVRPNSLLAAEAGLECAQNGAIVVDERQRTADPDIYACGDCVETFSAIDGKPVYIPLGTTANKHGKIAGLNAAGKDSAFKGVLGSQITKVFELFVGATGFSADFAAKRGFTAETCSIVKYDKASYYPGARDNRITLVFQKGTGRLLGAQAAGSAAIAGRLNVVAAAITAGMTLDEFNTIDYVYAPPVAPVYDPLLIAGSQAAKLV